MVPEKIFLKFLGAPRIVERGCEHFVKERKVILLLFLLAINKSISRFYAATLLWPEMALAQSQGNLRNVLHRVRKSFPTIIDGNDNYLSLSEHVQTDIAILLGDIDLPLEIALEAHVQKLLNGDDLSESPYFQQKLFQLSQDYQSRSINAIHQEIKRLHLEGKLSRCIVLMRRILLIAPFTESAIRGLMSLYAENGDRPSALEAYENFRQALRTHYGIDPEQRTTQLHLHILRRGAAESADPAQQARVPDTII